VTRHASLAETAQDAELIVEAIIERPDAKRALYAELDEAAPAEAIWASNTSYLDVFPLIPERRQRRAMIAHWYTPPYLVDSATWCPARAASRRRWNGSAPWWRRWARSRS
jgi:3-hydroxybutyryl-CoA dehydrogenase